MGGNGKPRRWRISFHRSSAADHDKNHHPVEFLCPISNSLMFDPVVVSSGQTFERVAVDVCRDLGFTPSLADGSKPDFSAVIPNLALKTAIVNWCKKTKVESRNPPTYAQIESTIRAGMGNLGIGDSERDLLAGVAENPQVLHSHAATELGPRNLYTSSSSDESVVANTTPLLPFATRPSCLSYSSPSELDSAEFAHIESLLINDSFNGNSDTLPEHENLVVKMRSSDVIDQEQGVILLRKMTRSDEEARAALCSDKILLALKRLLVSRYATVQTNATAALVNLSLAKANKVKIVRAGVIPLLIDILKNGLDESREHAAGAMFSLALDDENKTAIGVLGALQPLLHELRSGTRRSRQDAALALYHLTLMQSNRVKIVKLGSAGVLLGLLKDPEVAARVVLVICNLAACEEGRAALLDAGAVRCLLDALGKESELESESTRENCVAALHSLSHGSLRFKGLARDAGAANVLREVAEKGSERAREKAKRILEGLKAPEEMVEKDTATAEEGEEEEVDWEAIMKGGVSQARHHRVRSRYSA